jgi:hypothetical protein
LLTEIVQDGRRLLSLAEEIQKQHPAQAEAIATDAALLLRLITQNVEEKPEGGCQVKSGTAKDRVLSVHDPEMRRVGAAKRTSAGGEGRRNGGRLCLRRRPEAASLCGGRTNPDGQGAGQSQPQLFFQE